MAQSKRKPALIAIPRQGDRGSPPSPRSATLAPASQAAYASHAQSSALDSSERTHVTAQGNFNGNTGGGGGVILRIKRKRGTEPVDALRIGLLLGEEEEEQVAAGGSKRRIVEKSKEDNSGAVFRLAETVSLKSFSDPKLALRLSSRLAARYPAGASKAAPSALVQAQAEASSQQPSAAAATPPPTASAIKTPVTPQPQLASGLSSTVSQARISASLRFQVVRPAGGLGYGAFAHPRGIRKSVGVEATGVKMGKARSEGKLRRSTSSASLSSVKSHSSARNRPPSRLRIIDAVAVQQGERRKRKHKTAPAAAAQPGAEDTDVEMKSLDRRFADMLTDYLAEKDLVPPSDIYEAPLAPASTSSDGMSSSDEDEEDYVYDVYYRDSAPGGGLSGLADSGMHPLPVPGHSVAPSLTGPSVPAEIATLEGLRAADLEMDDAEALDMGGAGSGDDEWDEGEDEDSNDEGFYRNDYPDQEALDSDEETFGWDGKGEEEESEDGSSF